MTYGEYAVCGHDDIYLFTILSCGPLTRHTVIEMAVTVQLVSKLHMDTLDC